jgi:hypothetical protein
LLPQSGKIMNEMLKYENESQINAKTTDKTAVFDKIVFILSDIIVKRL